MVERIVRQLALDSQNLTWNVLKTIMKISKVNKNIYEKKSKGL